MTRPSEANILLTAKKFLLHPSSDPIAGRLSCLALRQLLMLYGMFNQDVDFDVTLRIAANPSNNCQQPPGDMGELRRKVYITEQIVGNIEKRVQSLGKKGTLQTCFDVRNFQSGIYQLQPQNLSLRSFKALCDNDYSDGGWTVIQNRFNGSVDFYRGWKDYEEGFGDLEGEFWLGLEKIHQLTSFKRHELHVLLKDFEGNSKVAKYDDFRVADKAEKYTLESLGEHGGTAGDSLHYNRGEKFRTFDSDTARSIAKLFGGAWWYHSLFQPQSNLNGKYTVEGVDSRWKGMFWRDPDGILPYL
ncbi:microfibril-associated glycoprotein 4-like [Uranotaenia lowii]|uniref:microfibril-associated glycoprotein 4-like n=1 Tax=Uranotaenia lowii TaxID=190385 RepID=UPI00247A72BD|nr:microfibril-associated glycoprotein 4-like [Uranotaenia lowii]